MIKLNKKKTYRELELFRKTQIYKKYTNLSFSVVLVQPETGANIGSIARVMKNFNIDKLIIFNPIESVEKIRSRNSQGFAMHGSDILLSADIIKIEKKEKHISEFKRFLEKFDLIIATTSKGERYTNLNRLSIFPEDLIDKIPNSKKPLKIGIIFGKESSGLTNEEINLADISIRIPTSSNYPTLNISHACGIILYEIFKKINHLNLGRGKNPVLLADRDDRLILYKLIKKIIELTKIRAHRKSRVHQAFKNVFERSIMSKKELSLIVGLFSKMNSIVEDLNLYDV